MEVQWTFSAPQTTSSNTASNTFPTNIHINFPYITTMKRSILILILAPLILISCITADSSSAQQTEASPKPKARNIIYLIGDGMGINQVYAAMTAAGGNLAMERCTATALVKTFSANRYITDSAAGGTALACGKKTNNGMLGMTPDSTSVQSLLEHYRSLDYATGLVVTSPITHATPASFYAHVPNRNMYDEIAVQLYNANIDFFSGGGRRNFEQQTDSISYTDSLIAKGYTVHYSVDSIPAPTLLPCAILAAQSDLPDARNRANYLPLATDLAIKSLKAKAGNNGFFLMVEASQIDYRCHGNDADGMIAEVLDFDKAIDIALRFAEADGNTLVIITADHETGGVSITDGSFSDSTVTIHFGNAGQAGTSSGHTGTLVPLFAFGPGAEHFAGIIQNTDVPNIIRATDK